MEKTTKPFLHDDALQEILSRLPMKRLAHCKRLSKYWNSIISRPRFSVEGRSHLPNCTLLVYPDFPVIYPRHQDGDSFVCARPCFVSKEIIKNDINVVGTWDGLICFAETKTGNYTTVWSPVLNDVQKCQFEHEKEGLYNLGFGFDPINNDYKVIKIIQSKEETSIEVHNLYTKVASLILLSLSQVTFKLTNAAPVTVNGYSHWIGVNLQNHKLEIVWFDLGTKKFVNVPFSSNMPNIKYYHDIDIIVGRKPNAELEIDDQKFRLGIFKGSVCLFVSRSNRVEVWCMKNYGGDRNSSRIWNKEFDMELYYPREKVIGFNANDEMVIAYEGEAYIACNPWTQQVVYLIGNNCEKPINQVVTYMESLVPVKQKRTRKCNCAR